MRRFIDLLKEKNLLKIINEPLDIYLEIPHVAYVEVKKKESKALLFTHPIDKRNGREFNTPVVMNLFGSEELVRVLVGDVERIASDVGALLKPKMNLGFFEAICALPKAMRMLNIPPKRTKNKGLCQQVIKLGDEVDLSELPILTTWERDGGAFITMGQVYTQSIDDNVHNLGMYRLQVYNKNRLGLHWQIHKDSAHLFHEYKKTGTKMPVSIAIGGDPLYTWCGTAPLPHGVFELLLYGFIRNHRAELVKCRTNPLYVPYDADFVIEGWVDPEVSELEGPFGDHTGFYTPIEPYPVLEVSAITHKQNPLYLATVVGKPPLEDKYLGFPTERIFLPLLKTTAPNLIDYYMPENGVFHNLILAKIAPNYPGHASQIMHAFWGVGQMSFVKHAIFVDESAPSLRDGYAFTRYVLDRFSTDKIVISEGICDALDHASLKYAEGGKLALDATGEIVQGVEEPLSDERLSTILSGFWHELVRVRQIFIDTKNPITLVGVKKGARSLLENLADGLDIRKHTKIIILLDDEKNDLKNLYMVVWRVVNNIDAKRDVKIYNTCVIIDATDKCEVDGYTREWPLETDCTKSVIDSLCERKIIEINDEFERAFHLCSSPKTL